MYINSENRVERLIEDRELDIILIVNCVFITNIVCMLGIVANCLNMIVFYKQGFENTINISLLGLTLSDLCSLISLQWILICVNPWFSRSDVPWSLHEVQYLTGSMLHLSFVRITGLITCYITTERCLCITFPLKIKQIVTPRRTTIIIAALYTSTMIPFCLEYGTCYFDWKFYKNSNKTMLGLVVRDSKKGMPSFIYFLYSILGFASFLAVIASTFILVVQLKRKSKWRLTAHLDTSTKEAIFFRDRKTISMVAMIAGVLIACYTPGVLTSITTIIEPEMSLIGRYTNTFFALWSFSYMFEAVNSAINIFIYYKMGTAYRNTFRKVFGTCCLMSTTH